MILDNLLKINCINQQKKLSIHLDASFNVGLIFITNLNNIHEIEKIKLRENLHYIVVVRQLYRDILLEKLAENYKFIDMHLTEESICDNIIINYKKSVPHEYFTVIN